jgi:hypothetical protein
MRQAVSAGVALVFTLALTIGLAMALDRLGEGSRITTTYTALL